MLDREKQAKKQQDTEYEGAGGRPNNEELQTTALHHALASGIDCKYSRRLRRILRSTKKQRKNLDLN